MSEFYDELIKEGAKLREQSKKSVFLDVLFLKMVVSVMYTFFMCNLLSKLEIMLDLNFSSIGYTIGFIVIFFGMSTNLSYFRYMIYISFFALQLVPKYNYIKVSEIIFKLFIMLTFAFVILLVSKMEERKKLTIFFMCLLLIVILCAIFRVRFIATIILIFASIFYIEIFYSLEKLIQEKSTEYEKLNEKSYGYLFCMYTLFMCMCIVMI